MRRSLVPVVLSLCLFTIRHLMRVRVKVGESGHWGDCRREEGRDRREEGAC